MKRRLVILLAVAVLGLATLLIYRAVSPPLPSHNGHSLEFWLQKIPADSLVITWPDPQTRTAIQDIGTNGLPYILSKFRPQSSTAQRWLEKVVRKFGLQGEFFRRARIEEQRKAAMALVLLKPLPPDVEAELRAFSKGKESEVSRLSQLVLLRQLRPSNHIPKNWY